MAQASQQQSNSDNSMAPIWITVLLFITIFLIWYGAHRYIVQFIFSFTLLQANLISLFVGSEAMRQPVYLLQTLDPGAVTWGQAMDVVASVTVYLRYPFAAILGIMALILYQSDLRLKYRKPHNMKTLRAQEQYNWKAIMPVVKLDLVAQDISEGPWAMALTPIEFARKYHLLRKEDDLLDKPVPGEELTAGVRKGDAKRVFTLQLGPYWDGFEKLSPHATALAAVFVSRINRDRVSASKILERIDESFSEGKPDFTVISDVLNKYKNTELVQEVVARHAYTLTVLASLLQAARNDGVVPVAEFLWLKPVDRRLWYMLNSVGRQTPFSEVGGPFAHWRAEISLGRRSLVPMIDEAIKALELAVKEVKLPPRELQELLP